MRARWREGYIDRDGDDFALSDDRNNTWTQCGAVYSRRICCPDYALAILGVLSNAADGDKWGYHTAVEVWRESEGEVIDGEFVLKGGRMYVPRDRCDYSLFYTVD